MSRRMAVLSGTGKIAELSYMGTITSLSVKRTQLAAAVVGDFALFAGGRDGGDDYATVDAYDTAFTRSIPTALSAVRHELAGGTVGGYALFGGGDTISETRKKVVDAYDSSLTRSVPTALSTARSCPVAGRVPDYLLFAGGYTGSAYSAVVDAYDASLTRTTATALSSARIYHAAASIGDYVLFGGGGTTTSAGSAVSTVEAYNSSLVKSLPTPLSSARTWISAATVGRYALFAGGADTSGTACMPVDVYDSSLTRLTPVSLQRGGSYHLTGASAKRHAVFAGGYSTNVDTFNGALTYGTLPSLSGDDTKAFCAAAVLGDAVIFAGGQQTNASTRVSTADVYKY